MDLGGSGNREIEVLSRHLHGRTEGNLTNYQDKRNHGCNRSPASPDYESRINPFPAHPNHFLSNSVIGVSDLKRKKAVLYHFINVITSLIFQQ
jgi:hypothetical protein